jgi:hypothetical protein
LAPDLPGWFVIWYPDEETLIIRGSYDSLNLPYAEIQAWVDTFGGYYELVAYAYAYDLSPGDDVKEVGMYWWQVFPCIDFTADILIHYTGCIPAKVDISPITWAIGPGYTDFSNYMTITYLMMTDTGEMVPVPPPVQMHYCNYLWIQVNIHIPQDNDLQDLYGMFAFTVHAQQWNELCDTPPPPKVLNLYEDDVTMWFYYPGAQSTFDAHLSGVPAGYDPVDGTYLCWCVDEGTYLVNNVDYNMKLMSSYDPANPWPGNYLYSWYCVNYIINHKGSATPEQIQLAIYYFVDGGYSGTDTVVWDLINDALLYGQTFVPGPGEMLAVLCIADPEYQNGYTVQHVFIEVDP